MHILLTHNHYIHAGGEDMALESEAALLRGRGHRVTLYKVNNDRLASWPGKLQALFTTISSTASRERFDAALRYLRPDVVHVHNFFPRLTPAIFDACREVGIPSVLTLHNYRTICPGALFLRSGAVCERCLTGSVYQAVRHRCYRNSLAGSWVVARMVIHHRKRQTWKQKVDRFIALTDFGRKKFVAAGFPEEKIAIKPNVYPGRGVPPGEEISERTNALCVGRLSREKGVATLLAAWREESLGLRLAGDGPLMPEVRAARIPTLTVLGSVSREEVSREMASAAFLVMPSECYEGFPMVLVEAFAHGLPVLASRLGAMAEVVTDGVTGLHFSPGDPADLAAKVRRLRENPAACRRMGENARRVYEERYSPERNYQTLMDIYAAAGAPDGRA